MKWLRHCHLYDFAIYWSFTLFRLSTNLRKVRTFLVMCADRPKSINGKLLIWKISCFEDVNVIFIFTCQVLTRYMNWHNQCVIIIPKGRSFENLSSVLALVWSGHARKTRSWSTTTLGFLNNNNNNCDGLSTELMAWKSRNWWNISPLMKQMMKHMARLPCKSSKRLWESCTSQMVVW